MTELSELLAYWKEQPPAHIMLDALYDLVAQLGGGKPRSRTRKGQAGAGRTKPSKDQIRALAAQMNRSGSLGR